MGFFVVDTTRCVRCGTCAAVCPIEIIVMGGSAQGADAVEGPGPLLVEGGEKACIRCGHCVAVCPTRALSIEGMPAADCAELADDWRIPPVRLEPFLKGRRSIRCYTEKPVDRVTLEKLIDIARYAPSGINRQPVYWAVVQDSAKVHALAAAVVDWMRELIAQKSELAESLRFHRIIAAWERGSDPVARRAPHIILAYGLKEDPLAPAASTIALTYLELTAVSFGLGACWAGYIQMAINMSDTVRKVVGLSSRTTCTGAMLIGHPRYQYKRIPLRNEPRVLWR